MTDILFATGNKAKIAQFQFVADSYVKDVKIVSLYERFPDVPRYNEEYATQEEIIEKGAREVFAYAKTPFVLEDTILEVDALGGMPGLRSNEYLKEHGREGLLEQMKDVANRSARITSIVACFDGDILVSFKNVVEGKIAREESYKTGEPDWVAPTPDNQKFGGGFSAVFVSHKIGKTLADISAQEVLTYGYRDPNFKAVLTYLMSNALNA